MTIVILIILAAISINMIIGDNGIITMAEVAKEEMKYSTVKETKDLWILGGQKESSSEVINKLYNDGIITENEKEKLLEGETITIAKKEISIIKQKTLLELYKEGTLEIGDYIYYEPSTSNSQYYSTENKNGKANQTITKENLKWRVLGTNEEETNILIISEKPTTQTVTFSGVKGYNNAVEELNAICKTIYSSNYGNARSIEIKDIEEKSNFDYESYYSSSDRYGYGDKAISTRNLYCPNKNAENGYELAKNDYIGNYYGYNNFARREGEHGELKDVMSCELLLGSSAEYEYWIADECISMEYSSLVNMEVSRVYYYIRNVGGSSAKATYPQYVYQGGIGGYKLYDADNKNYESTSSIRPIVELNTNCYLDYEKSEEPSYRCAIDY